MQRYAFFPLIRLLSALVWLWLGLAAPQQVLAAPAAEAEAVVRQYFAALQQGDVATVRSLLGGDLLLERSRLLSNPTYPATLQQWYQGAQVSLVGSEVIDPTRVRVQARVSWSAARQVQYRFVLETNPDGLFLIHAEEEAL